MVCLGLHFGPFWDPLGRSSSNIFDSSGSLFPVLFGTSFFGRLGALFQFILRPFVLIFGLLGRSLGLLCKVVCHFRWCCGIFLGLGEGFWLRFSVPLWISFGNDFWSFGGFVSIHFGTLWATFWAPRSLSWTPLQHPVCVEIIHTRRTNKHMIYVDIHMDIPVCMNIDACTQ